MWPFKKKCKPTDAIRDGQKIIDLWYCPNCGNRTDGNNWQKCAVCGKKTCSECYYQRGVLMLTPSYPYRSGGELKYLCKEHYQYAHKVYPEFFKLLKKETPVPTPDE